MRLRIVLAVAALAGMPAAQADAADRIAFAAGGDIQLISPAGAGLDNLTATPAAIETRPAWSPDAQRIAYMRLNAGRFEIWTMKPDGSAQAPLVTHPTQHAVAPTWSPDGRRIAYNLQDPASSAGQIVATDLDGANPVTLASGVQVNNFGLWWSPTGQQVAFGTSGLTLYVAATNGSGASVLLGPPTQLADQPKWSPKGDRIAYLGCESATQCNNSDIWIMDADASDRTRLTTDPLGDTAPAISANGDRIAYTRFQGCGWAAARHEHHRHRRCSGAERPGRRAARGLGAAGGHRWRRSARRVGERAHRHRRRHDHRPRPPRHGGRTRPQGHLRRARLHGSALLSGFVARAGHQGVRRRAGGESRRDRAASGCTSTTAVRP